MNLSEPALKRDSKGDEMKFLVLIFIGVAFAHEGHDHGAAPADDSADQEEALVHISLAYESQIKPIFERACYNCHGGPTKYPWYYKIPGAKQLIDSDIKEAHKHLDMTGGFPFQSHATPKEDLEAIIKSINDKTMPPFEYRILHSESKLTDAEKDTIKTWATRGLELLKM